MSAPLKRWVRFSGIALSLLCVGFVAWRLSQLAPQIRQLTDWPTLLSGLATASLVYAAGALFLALAWALLLRALARPAVPLRTAARGHMRAQLAKYLPGNVFHLAARHVQARLDGLDHLGVASAAMAESVLLVAVAVCLSMLLPATGLPPSMQSFAPWRWPLVGALVLGLAIGAFLLRSRGPTGWSARMDLSASARLAAAAACYLAFFVVATGAFRVLLGTSAIALPNLLSIVSICWLGGFLVVGAPGGLGVREALLIGLLGPILGEAQALYAALAYRGATILGDFVVFLGGFLLGRRSA